MATSTNTQRTAAGKGRMAMVALMQLPRKKKQEQDD